MIELKFKSDDEIGEKSKDYVRFLRFRPQMILDTIKKYRKVGELNGILYGIENDEIGTWTMSIKK